MSPFIALANNCTSETFPPEAASEILLYSFALKNIVIAIPNNATIIKYFIIFLVIVSFYNQLYRNIKLFN